MAKRDCKIILEVNDQGELIDISIKGNVGSIFSSLASVTAYLIYKHNLNAEDVMATMRFLVMSALETNHKED